MAEPLPERTPTFEEILKTTFREVAKREIESDGTFKVEEVSGFINALANWHVTQSIIEGQKTLLKTNKETVEEISLLARDGKATPSDFKIMENCQRSTEEIESQIRQYEEESERHQEELIQTIKDISLENKSLEEKMWSLSDHLSAFARDIYKQTTKEA